MSRIQMMLCETHNQMYLDACSKCATSSDVTISRDNALCRMADMEDEKAINPEWNDEDEDHLSELKATLEKDNE